MEDSSEVPFGSMSEKATKTNEDAAQPDTTENQCAEPKQERRLNNLMTV